MSGIEVAGLVLGAIPILCGAVDLYKSSIEKSATAFRKRKYVEKLALALLLQKQILAETVKSVLIASGCEDVLLLGDDILGYSVDGRVQERVQAYLGLEKDILFSGIIKQSNDIIKKIAGKIADLVPTLEDSTDDLLRIIRANRAAPSGQFDVIRRVKLMFSASDLKDFVQELDETSSALDRFARVFLSNRQLIGDKPSRRALKLSKVLHQVRDFANNLHLALCGGWKPGCHSKHEAKLFLEDRVGIAADTFTPFRRQTTEPLLNFQLIFTASAGEQTLWHETLVRVYKGPDECSDHVSSHASPKVKIVTPHITMPDKPEIAFVGDICGAIEAIRCDQPCATFVLTEKHQVGMVPTNKKMWTAHEQLNTATLKAVFLSAIKSSRRGPAIPLKSRMLLALTLSSNLLQLLQTRWLESPWSKDMIHFVIPQQGAVERVSNDHFNRPFISLTFDNATPSHQQRRIEPKVALLELGILLLEIWNEMTLETRFSLTKAPTNFYERQDLASQWFDDPSNPPLPLYNKAVSHCIYRIVGGEFHSDWEDSKFWGAVCVDIIEPLSKIC